MVYRNVYGFGKFEEFSLYVDIFLLGEGKPGIFNDSVFCEIAQDMTVEDCQRVIVFADVADEVGSFFHTDAFYIFEKVFAEFWGMRC